jgi:hypothetical protein
MQNYTRYSKFFEDSVQALDTLSKRELLLFIYFSTKVDMQSNELRLNRNEKDRAALAVNIKPISVNNFLSKFCKKDLMLNLRGGTYLLNPNISNRSKPPFIPHLQQKYQEQKMSQRRNQGRSHLEL